MTVCLNMIVKNEATQIRSTLENVLEKAPISKWCIHDTGSEDGTPELIQDFFRRKGIEGKIFHKQWENFGANRQYALLDAAHLAPWILIIDADDKIDGRPLDLNGVPENATAISMPTQRGTTLYRTTRVVRGDAYRWRGVVHEALYFKGSGVERVVPINGTTLLSERAGARSRDPDTYYRDAMNLTKAIEEIECGISSDADLLPRYAFYAANSWRDARVPREAAEWYRRRIAMGGWADEVYLSWLGLGIELYKLGDQDAALSSWLRGHEVCPDRAECVYHAARLQRERGFYMTALALAEMAAEIPQPGNGRLFLWSDVYTFWALFELAMAMVKTKMPCERQLDEIVARIRDAGAPAHLLTIIDQEISK